jgi:hypothetical protein
MYSLLLLINMATEQFTQLGTKWRVFSVVGIIALAIFAMQVIGLVIVSITLSSKASIKSAAD